MFKLSRITKSFGSKPLLTNFSHHFQRGTTTLLTGETGSGKTTLARLLLRLTTPESGEILYRGVPLESFFKCHPKEFRRQVQLLFQEASASLNPLLTIEEMLPVVPDSLLEKLELHPNLLKRVAGALSVGEKQRFALIRALASDPDFLILDEPTASLDEERSKALLQVVVDWKNREGKTLLLISHDPAPLRFFSKVGMEVSQLSLSPQRIE